MVQRALTLTGPSSAMANARGEANASAEDKANASAEGKANASAEGKHKAKAKVETKRNLVDPLQAYVASQKGSIRVGEVGVAIVGRIPAATREVRVGQGRSG